MRSPADKLGRKIARLEKALAKALARGEALNRAQESLLNLEDLPILFLNRRFQLADFSSAFSDLMGDVEDYLGEPISLLLKEKSWMPIRRALARRNKILKTSFAEGEGWNTFYRGPARKELIGNQWFTFRESGRWRLAPGEIRLDANRENHASFLTLATPVGGEDQDLRVSFTIHTPARREEIRDLSAVLSGTDGADGHLPDSEGYFIGLGAAGNRRLEIQKRWRAIAKNYHQLEPDRRYQVKILRLGGHIELWLDGQLMLSVTDINPLYGKGQEFFSLCSSCRQAAFRDLVIETRPAALPREFFCVKQRFEVELAHMPGQFFELCFSEGIMPGTLQPAILAVLKDITRHRKLERHLDTSRERYRSLVENLPVGLFQAAPEGELLFANRKVAEILGYGSAEELIEKESLDVFFWNKQDRYELLERLLRDGQVRGFIFPGITRKKRKVWLDADLALLPGGDKGGRMLIQGTIQDFTKLKYLEDALTRSAERIKLMSITDDLTHTYSPQYFRRRLEQELERNRRYNRTLTLMIFDIDNFRRINSRLGRSRADLLLRQLAGLVRGVLRDPDVLCRYGGGEFAVLLPETDRSEASSVAERLLGTISRHRFDAGGTGASLTVSLGRTTVRKDVQADEVLRQAGSALAAAKDDGGNNVKAFKAPSAEGTEELER